MNYQVIKKNNKNIIRMEPVSSQINSEDDGMELIGLCFENSAAGVVIPGECLSDNFLNLRTGVAGEILQKMAQYNIKLATLIDTSHIGLRFNELILESNKGSDFRNFGDSESAALWIAG